MPEHSDIRDLADFVSLNISEFGNGVVAFVLGEPEPFNVTRSHYCGWRAAAMEAGVVRDDGVLAMLALEAALDCDMRGFA